MLGRSFAVARIFGITIEIHPSWLLILGFVAYTLSDGLFPHEYKGWSTAAYWVVGTSAAVLLFATVLVHELAHAVVAIRRGLPVPKITLFIFGGVSHLSRQPRSPGEEFAIAAAGPATSLVIAGVTGAAGLALAGLEWGGVSTKVEAVLFYLAGVNVLLGVFNILPGFPLDGGRVLRSIAWRSTGSFRRATRIAAGTGEVFAYLLMAGGFLLTLNGAVLDGLWFLFIGWFLLSAARNETGGLQLEAVLAGLAARDVMREGFPVVVPGMPLQQVVDDHMIGAGERAVVVANGDTVLGILTVSDIRHTPREAWGRTPAQTVMTPRERVVTVTGDTRAIDVLMIIGEKRLNQVPVLDDGRMVGLITRRELLDRVQLAQSLAPGGPAPEPAPGPSEGPGPPG